MFSICTFLRFNTSLHQFQFEIDSQYKTIHQHIERFTSSARSRSTKYTAHACDTASISAI
ncbi:DNA topoisomerase type IA zn finger domain-containing protein [Natrialba asiatica DSM 12278]|uniref:DNA topoisomerase type IA zn finger domain-containing protein n=1 Tax=Natrialba asiatica (strain ATCC 700177 / DSM 12278 / JCM 9576 / FERM P-10747 / NBRC 102637 / 172P1) TaxID=29540 RepID=M0B2D4_NATA1|nr:DNA topoisomerase type IA zn finger domain-containing protein [Natrialba asiatica DSM 12278]